MAILVMHLCVGCVCVGGGMGVGGGGRSMSKE